jgi:3-deoxy-D-manno-octulosonic-acid transferase
MDGLFHLLAQQNLPFVRRTLQNDSLPLQGNILILDTVGELVEAYRRSLAAFVGGSFVPTGGHNILEVTAAGRHVYFGPSMHNFREFEELALSQHLGTRMETPEAGQGILANDLLNLQDLRQRGIENQHRLIRLTGASRRTARLIKQFLSV